MFSGGPFLFPVFCKGVRMPKFSSSSCSPVSAIRLKIIALCLWISTAAYLMYSSCVPSHPSLFQFFSLEAAWLISSVVKGFSSLDGRYILISWLVGASIFVKCYVMMFAFAESVPPKFPSSSCTYSSFFLFLFFSFLIAA